jgi:tetratricopeptide (TPR) repeat protein
MIRINYSLLLTQMGRQEKSLDQMEKALQFAPGSSFVKGVYGSLLYYTRQYDQAIALLKEVLAETTRRHLYREQALDAGDIWLRYIKAQPLFDDVRSDIRYKALLEKLNLEVVNHEDS